MPRLLPLFLVLLVACSTTTTPAPDAQNDGTIPDSSMDARRGADISSLDGVSGPDAPETLDIAESQELPDLQDELDLAETFVEVPDIVDEDVEVCVPNCTDAACGDDGCGGSCGTCAEGDYCVEGQCECKPACPSCNMDDGCGGFCLCQEGWACILGECKDCYDGPLEFPDQALAERVAEWYGTEVGETTMADVVDKDYLPVVDRGVLLLDGLGCLTGLNKLYLDGNDFHDLSPIAGMPLGLLSIIEVPVESLAPLRFVPNLTWIAAQSGEFDSLEPLEDHNLHFITVQKCENITSLDGLENQSMMNQGVFIFDPIEDISAAAGWTAAFNIKFNESNVSDLTPLAGLVGLEELHLSNCMVTDVTPLAGLTGLRILNLGGNKVVDFGPLWGLANLVELSVSGSHNPNMVGIGQLTNMEMLLIGSNDLIAIPDLSSMTKLDILDVWNQDIADLSPVVSLTSLSSLQFEYNMVTDLTPLVDNPGIGEGDFVDARYNPIDCSEQWDNIQELYARGVDLVIQCPCEVCLD